MQYRSVVTARVMPRALQRSGSATWRCAEAGSTRAAWRPTLVSGLQGTLVVNGPRPERFFVGMCRAPRDDMLPGFATARDARVLDCTVCWRGRRREVINWLEGTRWSDEGTCIYGWSETIVKEFPCPEFLSFCAYFCPENLFCWHCWHLGVPRQVP